MSEWKEYRLEDIAELRSEKFTPNESVIYPYIGLEHIEPKALRLNGIGTSDDVSSQKSIFYPNDILYGKLRPYFQKVFFPKFKGVCSTDIFVVKSKNEIDSKFLFYLLASDEFTALSNLGSKGTHMPRADWSHLKSTLWNIPSYQIQKVIAEILSSLDDKIELNNKINQELESLTQLLFKRWFVDFEFPNENGEPYKSSGGQMVDSELGQIPKGWRLGKFGELVDVINGYAFKSKDFDNSQEEGIVKIKNINGLTVEIKNTDFVSSNVVSNLNRKFKINSGDILIAMTGAEVGKIGVVPETKQNLWLNQRVGKVVPKDVKNTSFIHTLYNFLNLTDVVKNEAMGSAQPNISSTGIESIKILIPAQVIIEEFSRIFNDKYFLFVSSLAEIQTLSELRDTLLPKLISGELQINNN